MKKNLLLFFLIASIIGLWSSCKNPKAECEEIETTDADGKALRGTPAPVRNAITFTFAEKLVDYDYYVEFNDKKEPFLINPDSTLYQEIATKEEIKKKSKTKDSLFTNTVHVFAINEKNNDTLDYGKNTIKYSAGYILNLKTYLTSQKIEINYPEKNEDKEDKDDESNNPTGVNVPKRIHVPMQSPPIRPVPVNPPIGG